MLTRTKIVLVATLFNLSFEFAFRGFKGMLIRPGLILFLFFTYFAYFTIVEHLIRKYKITNKQLLLVAFCYGLLPMTFLTGAIFTPPLILGVNIIVVLGVNIIWWGFIQGLLTFYLTNRLVKRNWNEPLSSPTALRIAALYLILSMAINFYKSTVLPKGTGIGYLTVFVLFFAIYMYLKSKLKQPQQPPYEFQRSRLLDLIAVVSIVVFAYSGLVLAKEVSLQSHAGSVFSTKSASATTLWTQIASVGIIIYYLKNRKQITV